MCLSRVARSDGFKSNMPPDLPPEEFLALILLGNLAEREREGLFAAGDCRSPLATLGAAQRASNFAPQSCRTRLFELRGFESRRGNRERMATCYVEKLAVNSGGERGIRTLEGLLALTPLAGVRLRPLGHLSGGRNHKDPERFLPKNERNAPKMRQAGRVSRGRAG
jgi:hypothetical protein